MSNNVGPIVGGVIGGVVGLSTTLVLVFLLRRRLQRQSHLKTANGIVSPYPISSDRNRRIYVEEEQIEGVGKHVDSGVCLPPRENEVPPMYTEA